MPPRLVGAMLVAASVASTLAHRSVYEAAYRGPAQLAEYALGLATFMLASTGILLLVHGGRLLERARVSDGSAKPRPADVAAEMMAPTTGGGRVYDTRRGASLMQARHIIRASHRSLAGQASDAAPPRGIGRRSIPSLRR